MVSNAHVHQLTVSINFVTKRKKKDKEAFEIKKKKRFLEPWCGLQ